MSCIWHTSVDERDVSYYSSSVQSLLGGAYKNTQLFVMALAMSCGYVVRKRTVLDGFKTVTS